MIVVRAPSGYGKSVLLEQWADQDRRPAFTILLGPQHNDPTVLVESIVERLGALEPFPPEVADALRAPSPDVEATVVPRLTKALLARTEPFVLILDELERIDSPTSLAVVAALCGAMPRGSQLALAGRVEPAIGLARLRAGRRLTELDRDDLTMTKGESASLLSGIGVELSAKELDALSRRAEGWPAALYLSGLALGGVADPGAALAQFTGDDRVVVDYLRDEFLAPASRHHATFLRRAATMDRLSGALCDFALERDDSARVLHELGRSNMLLVPLDRGREWYRLHPLLRDMLHSELLREEAPRAARINLRASRWWSENGNRDLAIHHAIEAGDEQLAGELLFAAVPEYMTRGRNATVQSWLERLGPRRVVSSPGASLTAAWAELTLGCGPRAEHWTAIARRLAPGDATTPRDPMIEFGLALADAALCRDGLGAMCATASTIEPLLDEDSPWRSLVALLDGSGLYLLGRTEEARGRLREGVRRGSVGAPNLQVLCLSQLALIAIEDGDWQVAEQEVAHARAQIERTGIAGYPMLALSFAISACVRARRGVTDKAADDLKTGMELLAALDHFTPWYEIETKLMLATAAARLARRTEAGRLIASAAAQLVEVPDGAMLVRWVETTRAALLSEAGPAADLTPAELRLLHFLPEHLSLPLIAERLHVSPNTVKTHAGNLYRKLGATSRDEAVRKAREAGLLDAAD